jgi:hypothetical protein
MGSRVRFAHVWLRMRGCRKVSNAKETQPHASETHGGHGPVAVALCHGAHSACVLALSRATAGRLGPGGACHSEPIQSRQPVPLASVALLLRRARFDDAAGRLGLRRPHCGPRLAATAKRRANLVSRHHRLVRQSVLCQSVPVVVAGVKMAQEL